MQNLILRHRVEGPLAEQTRVAMPANSGSQNIRKAYKKNIKDPSYWKVVAEKLCDTCKSHSMVIILHNTTTQQPDSFFPDSGGSVLHIIEQLPWLAAF